MDNLSSSSSSQNVRTRPKRTKRKNTKRSVKKPSIIYTMKEIEEAVNLLNADECFFDDPYKFEELYCIQNIYKYDNPSIKSLDSLARIFQEALVCLENRDWKHFVLIIIKALQFPNKTRTLVRNFILAEVLYDPAVKNSDIAKQCLSIMFGPNVRHNDLIENLTRIPESLEKSDEDDTNEFTEI